MMSYRGKNNSGDNYGGLEVIAVIVFLIVLSYFQEKKRKKEISEYCQKNNIEYYETVGDSYFPQNARDFKSIHRGVNRSIESVMKIERDGLLLYIFDFEFMTEKEGIETIKNREYRKTRRYPHDETICLINKPDINFPKFYLRNKNENSDPYTNFASFGKQDIKIDGDSYFCNNFLLNGMPEEDVKAFFTQQIVDSFKKNHIERYRYEAKNDCFMVSIPKKMSIKERLDFLKNSLNLFNEIAG